jgi:hypothetical protein
LLSSFILYSPKPSTSFVPVSYVQLFSAIP